MKPKYCLLRVSVLVNGSRTTLAAITSALPSWRK